MSKGNKKKAKGLSHFKNALTGATYTKAGNNSAKATKAAADYAAAHPKKAFYA